MTWLLLLAGALAALTAGAYGVLRWRKAARRRRAAPRRLRFPLVLAHGVMGFDQLALGGAKVSYFRGIEERLLAMGASCVTVRVSPAASVEKRARQLCDAVRALGAPRVNIIAHSMGGLDARYALSHLGLSEQVAALVTVGTPHHGTPLAAVGEGLLSERLGLSKLLRGLGLDVAGFKELSAERMREFNERTPDARGVLYGAFLAKAAGGVRRVFPLLAPTYLYLASSHGENDGLVPVSSQRWGETLGTVEADHWAQIGWSRSFDAPAFYVTMVRSLIERGC